MGIRFRKDGEYVDNMGNLEVPPSHEQKQDGGYPPSKHPEDVKARLNPQFTKEYDDSFRGKVDDFINPGPSLKALLVVRAELEELKLENEVLSSKLKQIYLISNSK